MMPLNHQSLMEVKRLEAERELGISIGPEDWEAGTTIAPGGKTHEQMGLPGSAERDAKAGLARHIKEAVRERKLTQQQVADLTKLSQPDVSKVLRGQLRGFSEGRLRDMIAALGFDVRVVLEFRPRAGHEAGRVELVEAQAYSG